MLRSQTTILSVLKALFSVFNHSVISFRYLAILLIWTCAVDKKRAIQKETTI
jgi:hypothetical protein